LADGLAEQIQTVLEGAFLSSNVLDQRNVLDQIKDGNAVRQFTPQIALNALPGRHGIARKLSHGSTLPFNSQYFNSKEILYSTLFLPESWRTTSSLV
jgi:hypothetical protein